MDRVRFEALIAAYGADPKRWPSAEREAALAFAQSDGAWAQRVLAPEAALDAALDGALQTQSASDLLARRILKRAPSASFDRRAIWALAACAVVGVLAGYGGGMRAPIADASEDLPLLSLAALDGGEPGDFDE
jgi:hypothetical protein